MNSFLDLHVPGSPLLIPNPWDPGSARYMVAAGAKALATTSSGFAASRGRRDGSVDRDDVLGSCAAILTAVDVPVSADLEYGFGDTAEDIAETYRRASVIGLAGASIEDWAAGVRLPLSVAVERVAAARAAAPGLVLTGRTEGYFHGEPSLPTAIDRLQRYADAGADVVYAPGMTDIEEIRTLVREVPRPVNVLLRPGLTVPALADAGVARISVGGSLAWTAWDGFTRATQAFLAGGSDWQAAADRGWREATGVVR